MTVSASWLLQRAMREFPGPFSWLACMYTHIIIQSVKAKEDREPCVDTAGRHFIIQFSCETVSSPLSAHLPSVHICVHVWTHSFWPIPVLKAKSTFKWGGEERRESEGEREMGGRKKEMRSRGGEERKRRRQERERENVKIVLLNAHCARMKT